MKTFRLLPGILFALISLQLPAVAQESSISGRVVDKSTGKGMAYVHVQLVRTANADIPLYSSVTKEDGEFGFSGLSAGTYRVSVSHLGYHPQGKIVEFKADRHESINFELVPALIPLGEISVSSLRYDRLEREVSMPLIVVPRENMPQQSSMTLSDVLEKEPGVALYRDGVWGTSVSVRGLGENRLVSLVDGNRVETASDLAAGLSLIDVNEIERVELIKGAASSIYGTGALGGVINIITKSGTYMDKPGIQGEAIGLYEGVNHLFGSHIGLNAGSRKFRARLSGGYRSAGDIKTPEGIIENSQFTDRNINASLGFKPLKNHEITLGYQNYSAIDAGIPGGTPFGPSAIADYLLAKRRLINGQYKINNISPVINELSLRYYNQFIVRDVEMLPNSGPVLKGNYRITANKVLPTGDHSTQGLVFQTKLDISSKNRLVAGVDAWQRQLVTTREKYITQEILDDFMMLVRKLEIIRGEKPIPDSKFGSIGVFVQDEVSLLDDKLNLTAGTRIDRIQVSSDQAVDPFSLVVNEIQQDPVPGQRVVFNEQSLGAWSWSANASGIYHLTEKLDIAVNAGRSFRSPSLEERFKYIDLGSKVRLGDPDLKPEKGLFTDLGLRYWNDKLNYQLSGFVNCLSDMIVETPGEFVYRLTVEEGVGLTDTLPALVNANVEKALLTGMEASINIQLFQNFVFTGQAAFVRGMNLTIDGDLPLIPPLSCSLGARYYIFGSFVAEWTIRYFGAQNHIAPGEESTEGYLLSNVSLYSMPKQIGLAKFQFFAGVDNIFNESYRNHLATNRGLILSEPGRNVFVKLKMEF